MIKRTRQKFVAIAMLSVVLVLGVLMGILNGLNYTRVAQEADAMLNYLAEHGGAFPDMTAGASGEPSGEMAAAVSMEASGEPGVMREPRERDKGRERDPYLNMDAETPYETRYFSVSLDGEGEILSVDTTQIAAVDMTQAEIMAKALRTEGKTEGYYGQYRYLAQTRGAGVLYVFLDCTTDLQAAESFLKTSLLVSLGGVMLVYVLVLLLSGWAMRPMAVGYEKQKTFITNAGHELKTPLSVIASCTEVLELEQGESKWTDAIRTQAQRMGELTQELIALARLDEGTELPKGEFDLSAALEEELEMFWPLVEQKGLALKMDIQKEILYRGNETAIRQLAAILADNAVKYAPRGEIVVSLSRKGRKVILETRNPAEGFMTGAQPQLFERFYRGDVSHNGETSGYGIGLSIAEGIVSAHGGKIAAHSDDGESLRITVAL